MMRFKVDENLPVEVAELLREASHDAVTVLEQAMGGQSDLLVADVVRSEERALITLDLDFSNIRRFPPRQFHGLIVLRLTAHDKPRIVSVVKRLMPLLNEEDLRGKLWIVDEIAVRIRGDLA